MTDTVTLERRGNIALITVNYPPVNALSASVRQGLTSTLSQASEDDSVAAIVLRCEGRTFIAGADITEFGKPMVEPTLPTVLAKFDTIGKPIIAAIHGTALGGGLETALSCHYRIADSRAKVGLPEIKLGLLPGSAGTQRLPRLIGVKAALDIIVTGRQVKAAEALTLGIVDRVTDEDLTESAIKYAKEIIADGAKIRRLSELDVDTSELESDFFDNYRAKMSAKKRGFEAPQACISAVEASTTLSFADGMLKEREHFLKLLNSTQCAAQRHLFFADRKAAVINDLAKDTPVRKIEEVAIIGAGTMGSGIAINFLNAGIPVIMLELKQDALDRGLNTIKQYYESRKTKGRMTVSQADHCFSLLQGTLQYSDLSNSSLVIEAVFESMDVKRQVFETLDKVCKPGAILASNTSTLDVDVIANMTSRPQDVIGLHFFSPAQVMRLLEVIRGEKTAKDVMATAMKLCSVIGKVGVVSGVCDGFIGNRMLKGYGREAGALLLEGAVPQQIDKAMYKFGMAMGPMAMGDLAGLDVGYRVRKERRQRGEDVPLTDGAIADKLVELGRMGQKTSKGYYHYDEGSRTPTPDAEVESVIVATSEELGITRRDISDEEIVERLIYPLINEAALILEEKIAQRPSDIDVVWVNGYGFPIYRGGPMFYADTVGLAKILSTIESYQSKYGEDWAPAPLLKQLVSENKSFSDL